MPQKQQQKRKKWTWKRQKGKAHRTSQRMRWQPTSQNENSEKYYFCYSWNIISYFIFTVLYLVYSFNAAWNCITIFSLSFHFIWRRKTISCWATSVMINFNFACVFFCDLQIAIIDWIACWLRRRKREKNWG